MRRPLLFGATRSSKRWTGYAYATPLLALSAREGGRHFVYNLITRINLAAAPGSVRAPPRDREKPAKSGSSTLRKAVAYR
jgi:hypothetical protein